MLIGPILVLFAIVGIVATVVWLVQWASGGNERRRTALEILDERFASGEIDEVEFEAKRKLLGGKTGAR